MRSRNHVESIVALLALGSLLLAGCGREPTPDERRAAQLLQRGRQEVTRGALLEARPYLLAALAFEERLERPADAAWASEVLADGYAATASFDSALAMYDRSRSHYRAAAQRDGVRRLTLKIAALRRRMGHEREAFQMEVEALRLARVFKDEGGIREIQWAMLPSAGRLEELGTERELREDLLRSYTESRASADLARLALVVGRSMMERGSSPGAAEQFLQSTALAGRSGDSLALATALLSLGVASDTQGKTVEAFRHYGDALAVARTVRGGGAILLEVLLRVANGYLRYAQYEDARRFYRFAMTTAINRGNKIAEGYLTIQLGFCEIASNPNQARTLFESGLSLFRDQQYAPGVAYALGSLAHLAQQRGRPAAAAERYVDAIQEWETTVVPVSEQDPYRDCERVIFGPSDTPYHDRLLDILLTTGRHDEAFWYAERRARSALLRVATAIEPVIRDAAVQEAWNAYRGALGHRFGAEQVYRQLLESAGATPLIRVVRDSLRQAGQELARAREQLVRVHPAFAPLVQTGGLGMTEVQQVLSPEAALLSFVQGERMLHAFLITRERSAVRLAAVDRGRMMETAGELRALLTSEEANSDSVQLPTLVPPRLGELLRRLSEWCVRPVADELRGKSDLVVVLPPELAWLPVHTLRLGQTVMAPYLIERCAVRYLPVASAALLDQVPARPVQEVVALGYAGGTAWDVEYELRDIRAFYRDVRLHFQEDATLHTLLTARGDLLHLALDIRVTDRQVQNPRIILADGKMPGLSVREGIGCLTGVSSFVGVVVSDLRTGIAFNQTIVPLLLLANGTGTVVMNGFVPTRKAKRFFGEMFYTELLAGREPREAAHRAVLAMLRDREYASPSIWGAFVVWGGAVRVAAPERWPGMRPDGM